MEPPLPRAMLGSCPSCGTQGCVLRQQELGLSWGDAALLLWWPRAQPSPWQVMESSVSHLMSHPPLAKGLQGWAGLLPCCTGDPCGAGWRGRAGCSQIPAEEDFPPRTGVCTASLAQQGPRDVELWAASEQAQCGLGICRTCSQGNSRGWTLFRRAPALMQVCSGASSSNSTSLTSSIPFPTALAVPLLWDPLCSRQDLGGSLEGALHCGEAFRASGPWACWMEPGWVWLLLVSPVQLLCACCHPGQPVLRQHCHPTCSTGPTFLQPKSQ